MKLRVEAKIESEIQKMMFKINGSQFEKEAMKGQEHDMVDLTEFKK